MHEGILLTNKKLRSFVNGENLPTKLTFTVSWLFFILHKCVTWTVRPLKIHKYCFSLYIMWNFFLYKKKKKRQNPDKIHQQKFPVTEGKVGQEGVKGFVKVTESQWESIISICPCIRTFLQTPEGQEGDRLTIQRDLELPLPWNLCRNLNVFLTEEDCPKDPEGFLPKFSFPSISVASGDETLLQTLSTNPSH